MSKFTFRTSPPAHYIPPSREEMREAANAVGLKGFAPDLVADLTNLAAGGCVNPPSSYRSDVAHKVEEQLPAPDSDGRWLVPLSVREMLNQGRHYTKDRQLMIRAKTEATMRYHQNVCDFLQTVDLNRFDGATPLQQAMSLLKLLSQKQGGQGAAGEGGEPLPIFTDSERPESVAEELHEVMDLVDSLSEEELDMVDPDGESHEVESDESDGQRQSHKSLNRQKVAEDLVNSGRERMMLDISRTLDSFTKLQLRKQNKVEADPSGEEVRKRPIRHLGELSRVEKSAWAMRQQNKTLFLYKAVTGQLPVRERVTRIEKKQAVFILLDGSGSMSGERHWRATGVVMNRLKAVIQGEAEVYLSVFDTQLGNVEHASTPAEARELIKKFAAGNFSGGGTDIAASVKAAHDFIEEKIADGAALYRPEVVVLTDEDTSVSGLKKSEIKGTRVHGFAMQVKNPSLVAFAKSTGGVGIDEF